MKRYKVKKEGKKKIVSFTPLTNKRRKKERVGKNTKKEQ